MNPKTALVVLAALFLTTSAVVGQRVSPLIYDDPEFEWLDNRDPDSPRPSPNAFVGLQIGSARVMVAYGSPGVKGRQIFGGLVPHGRIWRTGANEATTLTANADILFGGQKVEAGTYSLFTIPGESEWTVILNRDNNQWGAYEHDPEQDFLEVIVPAETGEFLENFTIGFDHIQPDGSADLTIAWENSLVRVSVAEAD